jgi:hypothetical protein
VTVLRWLAILVVLGAVAEVHARPPREPLGPPDPRRAIADPLMELAIHVDDPKRAPAAYARACAVAPGCEEAEGPIADRLRVAIEKVHFDGEVADYVACAMGRIYRGDTTACARAEPALAARVAARWDNLGSNTDPGHVPPWAAELCAKLLTCRADCREVIELLADISLEGQKISKRPSCPAVPARDETLDDWRRRAWAWFADHFRDYVAQAYADTPERKLEWLRRHPANFFREWRPSR